MSLNDFESILKAGAVSMLLPFACLLCVPEIKAKASASKGSFASPSWIPLKRSSLTSCWGIMPSRELGYPLILEKREHTGNINQLANSSSATIFPFSSY